MKEKIREGLPDPVVREDLLGNETEIRNKPRPGKLLGDEHGAGNDDDPADRAAETGAGERAMDIFEGHYDFPTVDITDQFGPTFKSTTTGMRKGMAVSMSSLILL